MTQNNVPTPGDDLPPLVDTDAEGNLVIDFAGAIEHIPDQVLQPGEERSAAVEQIRRQVGRLLAETAARDLVDQILAYTNPEPDLVETADGGGVAIPPGDVTPAADRPPDSPEPPERLP